MMDGTFVTAFDEITAWPQVMTVNNRQQLTLPKGWTDATPKPPSSEPLVLTTLTGLCDYVLKNTDALILGGCLVHVKDPWIVELRGQLEAESLEYRRMIFLRAMSPVMSPFGNYHDTETFLVWLQTGFVQTESRDALLRLLASIRDSEVRETVDTGVSQEVKTGKGVALVGMTRVPNPVALMPYRTFREIEQPASLFVLRLKSGQEGGLPTIALYEADGGAWKLEAIQRIAAFLQERIGPLVSIVA